MKPLENSECYFEIKSKLAFCLNLKELMEYKELFHFSIILYGKVIYKQTAVGLLGIILQSFIMVFIFNFSVFPVKVMTFAGSFCLISSFLYFSISILGKFIYGDVSVGFKALLLAIDLLKRIHFFSLHIMKEHVLRTFSQLKSRSFLLSKPE